MFRMCSKPLNLRLDRDTFTKVRHSYMVVLDNLGIIMETRSSYHLIVAPLAREWKSFMYS